MLYKFKTFLKSNKIGRAIYEPIGYIYRKYYKDPQRLRLMKKHGYGNLRYIMEISEKLYFDYSGEAKAEALYSEMTPGGNIQVLVNTTSEESKVNIEALFNTVHKHKELTNKIFSK